MNKSNITPWKLLKSEIALAEKWFPVRKDTVELPSGRVVEDYFVWESPHIVQVVPVTKEGNFVMVRQYRHAIGKVLLQFPAGAVDKNETPEAGAARELAEETGYASKSLIHLGTMAPFGTKMSGPFDTFLALQVKQEFTPEYDDQEETEVVVTTPAELRKLLDSHELQGASTYVGIAKAFRYLKLPLTD